MRATKEMIEMSKKIIITYVLHTLAAERDMSTEEVFRVFAKSNTFALLSAGKAKLYTESPESVLAMYKYEECGDMENWLMV